jgi:hypothetical protein
MRLFRHLTFSNVIAVIALFIALGGAAYAGSKLNGKNIVNASIGGGKLKNETITARQIKKGTITGAQIQERSISSNTINLSTLGTVPSANTANSATKATSASTAASAENAAHANDASHATEADNAVYAKEAGNASHATEAENATHANEADRATIAGEAETLEGETAAQLTVSCPSDTEFYGGMCWDETTRPAKLWLFAVKVCGEEGGRLPSIEELIAFVLRPGEQVEEQTWSADLIEASGPTEGKVFTTDENGRGETGPGLHGYRCVFPLAN